MFGSVDFFHVMIVFLHLQINAMANKAAGKGYENENFYSNIKFQFVGIENIHIMRQSLSKLIEGRFDLLRRVSSVRCVSPINK